MKQRIFKKSTKLKNFFFLISKIDKSLVRLRKKKENTERKENKENQKKERALKNKIRSERSAITTDFAETKRIIRDCYVKNKNKKETIMNNFIQ